MKSNAESGKGKEVKEKLGRTYNMRIHFPTITPSASLAVSLELGAWWKGSRADCLIDQIILGGLRQGQKRKNAVEEWQKRAQSSCQTIPGLFFEQGFPTITRPQLNVDLGMAT
jgi:hypothetical protein